MEVIQEKTAVAGPYRNLEVTLNLEVPLIVVLAEKEMSLEEILGLKEGSVILFKKHCNELLEILVNNRSIGAGKTIKVNDRFGVHVRRILSPQETLEQLR